MPTYVYECKTCSKVWEQEQRITEDSIKDCSCGAKGSVRRLIQPVGVSFKGSGFHINDYADKVAAPDSAPVETKTETPVEAPAPAPVAPAPAVDSTP